MPNYGSHPKDLAAYLEHVDSSVISSEIMLSLGRAYKLVLDLENELPASTQLHDKQLIVDAIERAWREALYVRASLPTNLLEVAKESPVSISRMGVITENEENNKHRRSGYSDEGNNRRETNKGISKRKRGTRQYTRKISRGGG